MGKKLRHLPVDRIRRFCERWNVIEFSVFGSALRADFGPRSDFDVLVDFTPEAEWSLLDHIQMKVELQDILNRKVDLLTKRAVRENHNVIRREEILRTAHVIYTRQEA